jgi:hypothetical protein
MIRQGSREARQEEFKKRILTLSWDLSMISNDVLRKNKQLELDMLKKDLRVLASGIREDGKEENEREQMIS